MKDLPNPLSKIRRRLRGLRRAPRALLIVVFALSSSTLMASPQSGAPQVRTFTLEQAVGYALTNYPAVKAALEGYTAAQASVGVAATAYLPRVDGVWQGDRGTRNSVLGVLLPQSPNILTGTQGTVLPPSNRPFWTSGGGFLFSWEPFDFGHRQSEVGAARLTATRTAAQITLTRLGVAAAVAEASLAVLAEEQRVKAAQADVDRRAVFAKSVHALVDAHLRPGAEASRADAELAAATTGLYLAQESQQVASAALGELLGLSGAQVEIAPGPYLEIPSEAALPQVSLASHPAAVVEQDRIGEVEGRLRVLDHAYYPHFTLEALGSARGSGQNSKGSIAPGWNGLGADIHNWEAGLTVSLPLLDLASLRAQKKVEEANRRREQALYDQTMQDLGGQLARAEAALAGARRVAQNTPIQLQASRDSEAQARARFQAGLGTIVDVAEAQRLLVQAETDDSLARLAVWRGLAEVATAEGDLRPFFDLAHGVLKGAP